MKGLTIHLLGPPECWFSGQRLEPISRKSLALMTWLAMQETPQPRDVAAELLWVRNGMRNLRQELYVLRKLPGSADWLTTEPRLSLRCTTDVAAMRNGEDPTNLWRGLPGLGLEGVRSPRFQDWLATLRTEMEDLRIRALIGWVQGSIDQGDLDGAMNALTPVLEDTSTDSLWKLAVQIRLRQNRRSEAMALLESARSRFDIDQPGWSMLTRQAGAGSPLRALPVAALRVLQLSALDAEILPVSVLSAAAGVAPMELASALQTLHDSGYWDDGGVTALARKDALEGLTEPTQRVLHDAIAMALETEGASPERVAIHVESAGRADAPAHWLALARRTGKQTAVAGAMRTAKSDDDVTAALFEAIQAARAAGELDQADAYGTELEAHSVRTQNPGAVRHAHLQIALTCAVRREFERADTALRVCEEAMGEGAPSVCAARGMVHFVRGEFERALPDLERGLDAPEVTLRISSANALGAWASMNGELEDAHQWHQTCLKEARSAGRLSIVCRLLNSMGANALARADVGIAADWLDQAIRLAEEVGDAVAVERSRFNLCNAWIDAGAFGQARPHVSALLAEARTDAHRGRAFRCRAALERGLGRYPEARAWSTRAEEAFRLAGDALQATVCRFNVVLSDRPLCLEALEAVFEDIRHYEQPRLTRQAAAELALVHPRPAELTALFDTPSTPLEIAAHLRAALLGCDVACIVKPRAVNSVCDTFGWVLYAKLHPDQADAIESRIRSRFESWEHGLLNSQVEALRGRIAGWRVESAPTF